MDQPAAPPGHVLRLLSRLVAAVETLIALALIAGFARKLTYISAATFSVLIWATAITGPFTVSSIT